MSKLESYFKLACRSCPAWKFQRAVFCFWFPAFLISLSFAAHAQTPPAKDPLMQLMLSAPQLETGAPVIPAAAFDPAEIQPGGSAMYRVTLNTLLEAITSWPSNLVAAPELQVSTGARGQIFRMNGNLMQPVTVLNYHVTATRAGSFTVPGFLVEIYGRPVMIPTARLEVAATGTAAPPARRLVLELSETNAFVGQPLRARVLLPSTGGSVQGLAQVELNGDGFLLDRNDVRQQIAPTRLPDGREVPAFIYETALTPFVRGPMPLSAQGFTIGNRFTGSITIRGSVTIPGGTPEYLLLESEPVTLHVRPLPPEGRLPGFTGAIGKLTRDLPRLSTNSVRVGDPLKLTLTFHGEGSLARLAPPPAPRARGWQTFADAAPPVAGNVATFSYTFIPQAEDLTATPEIPFSYFDPGRGTYVDLLVPAQPVKILSGVALPLTGSWRTEAEPEQKLSLSPLAKAPGDSARSLRPLAWRGGFLAVALLPLVALLELWSWDRRRRYLEQHPEILRCRRARRALRRERRKLRRAAQAGDARGFAISAVAAMRVACAPHYPAEPRALVCGDVTQVLRANDPGGDTSAVARRVFGAADAAQFGVTPPELRDLLADRAGMERLLDQLEAQL